MKRILLFLTFFAVINDLSGQYSQINNDIDSFAKKNSFNGTILIQKGSKIIYQKGFGLANFQFNVPNKIDTKYRIASLTKLFTATLIMQLYEQGKIDLNQYIKTYLPNYAGEGGERVSIRNLLTATSGLESYEKNGDEVYENRYSTDELLNKYCSGKLENEPGKKFNYNNADYVILGKIVEEIYHKPFEQILSEKILRSLKMKNTGMTAEAKIIKNLANTYQWNDSLKAFENDPLYYVENYYAAGAMYSTAEDLSLFSEALYSGRLLNKKSLGLMLQPFLNNYAFGVWVYKKEINNKKVTIVERQGAINGANSRLIYVLEDNLTIVLLANIDGINLDDTQLWLMKKVIN